MVKILFLQSVYNLVDEPVEREMHNRIDFMHFLGFPERIQDSRSVWLFRERLSSTGKDKIMWKRIWKQFEDRGITIKPCKIQDASFIESDPGKHGRKKPPLSPDPQIHETVMESSSTMNEKQGMTKEEKRQAKIRAAERKKQRRDERKYSSTRRSKDGAWPKKGSRSYFGNKIHSAVGTDMPLIHDFVVTDASKHDSQIDLTIPDIPNYRDRGYSGSGTRGIDATMDRAPGNHPHTIKQIRRNLRITRKRSPGKRPYSVMKRIFHGNHVFVTMVSRVRVKATFICLGYNLLTLVSLEKEGRIASALKN